MEEDLNIVISKMGKKSLDRLIRSIPKDINIRKGPQLGLLMSVFKDVYDTDFCLGEVLVTEVEIEYRGTVGYSMIVGDEPERAILSAFINLLLSAESKEDEYLKSLKKELMRQIKKEKRKIAKLENSERKLLAKTKVTFETMSRR